MKAKNYEALMDELKESIYDKGMSVNKCCEELGIKPDPLNRCLRCEKDLTLIDFLDICELCGRDASKLIKKFK